MFKFDYHNTRITSFTSSWCVIVNFEHIYTPSSSIFIFDFEFLTS